jgi:hypothetical protein
MMGNVVAGFILSILIAAGGLAAIGFPLYGAYVEGWNLPMHAEKGLAWSVVALASVIGVGLLAGAVGLAWYSR